MIVIELHPVDAYGDARSITRIFSWFIVVILAALAAGIVIILASKDFFRAVTIAAALPLVCAAFFFVRRQRFEAAAAFLALVLLGLCTVIATQGLGVHSISNLGIAAILIVASMVTKARTMVFLTLFAIAGFAWQVFGELAGVYRPQVLERSVTGDFFTASLVIVATAFMVRLLSEALFKSHVRLRRELREREAVEEQREALIRRLGAEDVVRRRAEEDLTERARRLELVASVGKETTAILQLEETLSRAAALVRATFGYYNVSLFLARDGTIELVSTAQEEMQRHVKSLRLRVGKEGISGWVAGAGTPLLVPDVSLDSRYVKGDERVRTKSELAVPIRLRGDVIGVLDAQSEKLDAFSDIDTFTLQTVADQLAVAIENSRLYAETQRRAERLAVVNRVSAAVGATLALDDLLALVHAEIAPVFRADAFFVALYHEEPGDMEYRYQVDNGVRAPAERRPLGTGFSSVVIRTRRALLLRTLQEQGQGGQDLWGSMRAAESWLGVPMTLGDRVTGVISVQAYRPHAYGEEDLTLLATIADQVAAAVERARLYESLRIELAERTAAEEKFRSLAEQSPNMILIIAGGRVVYANRRCEEITGYTRTELSDASVGFSSRIAPRSPDLLDAMRAKHQAGEDVPPYEQTLQTRDGRRLEVIISTRLMTYAGESGILSVLTDITQQKKTERLLQGLNSASLAMEGALSAEELFPAAGAELRALGLDSLAFLLGDDPGDAAPRVRGQRPGFCIRGQRVPDRRFRDCPARDPVPRDALRGAPDAAGCRGVRPVEGAARGRYPGDRGSPGRRGIRRGDAPGPVGNSRARGRSRHHGLREPDRRRAAQGAAGAGARTEPARAQGDTGAVSPVPEDGGHGKVRRRHRP